MVSNWNVFWDSQSRDSEREPTFNRFYRGLELSGGVLTKVRDEIVLRRVQNPGTPDYYDQLELRPSGDITTYGRSRFGNPAAKLMMDYERAAVVNEISERKIAELFEELPNYADTYKGLRVKDRMDYGQSSKEYEKLMRELEKTSERALGYMKTGKKIPKRVQGNILGLVKKLIHTPGDFAKLDFDDGDFDAIKPSGMRPGFSREYTWEKSGGIYNRRQTIKAEGIKITNNKRFMETTADFWTLINHPKFETLDFFDSKYKSVKELAPKYWEKLKSGDLDLAINFGLAFVKQLNPDTIILDKAYDLENLIIKDIGKTSHGIKLHTVLPFDGLIAKNVSRVVPINYFADIFRLNYILKSNPEKIKQQIENWKKLLWLGSGSRRPKIIVEDIEGLGEYLASIIVFPSDRIKQESILKQLRLERFHRYMDKNSWNKIKNLRDKFIANNTNFDFEAFWYLKRSSRKRRP